MEKFPRIYNPEMNKKKEEEEKKGMSRRTFLKAALLGGGAMAFGYKLSGEKENLSKEKKDSDENIASKKEELKKHSLPEPPEWEYIPGEDREAAQHILGKFNLKKIHLDAETKNNTKSYWYRKYETNPKLSKSMVDAYGAMEEWKGQLEAIFSEEGVPEEYIYLAIPESHWNNERKSPAGALGVYQLMPETARMFGLKVDERADERKDILKSARAAAKLLADIYKRTGSWDLVLSGYNGGQIWKYLKTCGKNNCTYLGFLEYMQNEINQLKTDLVKPVWKHEVTEKEKTLWQIAQKYGVSIKDILRVNKLPLDRKRNPIIRKDDMIDIPIRDMKIKEHIYNRKIAGFIENLNYPGKYHAVVEHVRKMRKEKGNQIKND